ncbi:MAG: hypothetical protein RBS57_07755, partial [Desulforhabdus sp.]|nr:hypothetical protein [Desulforhabdus sp.]
RSRGRLDQLVRRTFSIGFVRGDKETVFTALYTEGLNLQNSCFVEVEDPKGFNDTAVSNIF